MAKFIRYQNGGVPGDLRSKFTEAGYESNADGTKFTKGNKVYKLNRDGTFNFVDKGKRKQNIKNIGVKALRAIPDIATLGVTSLGRFDPTDRRIKKAKKSDIDPSKVEAILTKQQEKDKKTAQLKKKRKEKELDKKEQILKDRKQRLLDKEAEKIALKQRKKKSVEEYTRKELEAEALKQKKIKENEVKKQKEAERLAPFADDIANFKRTPTGEVAHIDALSPEIKNKYIEKIQAELQKRKEGAIQMLSDEDFLKLPSKNLFRKDLPITKNIPGSFAKSQKNYGIDIKNWTPGQIVTLPDGSTKILVDIRREKGRISPNQKTSRTYLAFMDFETEETKEQTFNEAYRSAIKRGLKTGDTFKFKGQDILIKDDPSQTPAAAESGERRKEVTTETRKLSEDISKARLNKTGRRGMIAKFKKVNG